MFGGGNFERKEGAGVGRLGWLWDGGRIGTWIDELGCLTGNRKGKGRSRRCRHPVGPKS